MGFVAIYTDSVVAMGALTACAFVGADLNVAQAGKGVIGVARSDGNAGELVPVDMLGSALVKAGAAIPAFTDVEVGADGFAVPHEAGVVVGRTLRVAASSPGQMVEIFLVPGALS